MTLGYDLSRWAQREDHPCLTARTRQVLAAICMVAHDEHGEFWMRPQQFIAEYLPGMSYGAYRNHLMILVRNGLLIKIEQGGGRTTHGRGKTTRYRVNSPAVKNPQPDQHKLPDIVRSPEAPQQQPEVSEDLESDTTMEIYEEVEMLLASGITSEQILAILRAIPRILSDSRNLSDSQQNQVGAEKNLSGNLTGLDELPRNPSQKLTGLDKETRQVKQKPVSFSANSQRNLSGNLTGTLIHEEKSPKDKKHAAAAPSNLTGLDSIDFFDILAAAFVDSGHPGIRAAQFSDLTSLLADYANLTGSSPDERTANYIVGRVNESRGVRNVVGFARKITQDVLMTGEGFVAKVAREPPAPLSGAPSDHYSTEPTDWNLIHLAHGDQIAPAQEIWDAVLDVMRLQVSRPAFETWLSESRGTAYVEGKFIVGSPSKFVAEMLCVRMHPVIERAVRDITGTVLTIEYAVETQGDEGCPLCQTGEARAEAS